MEQNYFGGFGRRTLACLLDICIIGLLIYFIDLSGRAVLGYFFGKEVLNSSTTASALLACILPFFYVVYFHGKMGQTPGKFFLGLTVVNQSGTPVSYGTAFLRLVGSVISTLFLFFGFAWIIFDSKKQGWHDKIAKTYVLKVEMVEQFQFDAFGRKICPL